MSRKLKEKTEIKVNGIAEWLRIKNELLYEVGTFIATASGNFYEIGSQRIPAAMVEKPYTTKLGKKRNLFGEPLDGRQID